MEVRTKRYRRISDSFNEILQDKNRVQERGSFTGFKVLEPYISFIEGNITTIFGTAGSGKTQLSIEFSIYMAMAYKKITLLYLTEAGSFSETVLDICQTYLRKRLEDIEDEELLDALDWMSKYFYVIDVSDSLLDIREIYSSTRELEEDYGIKVHNIIIDHYHNINLTKEQRGMTIAEQVKFVFQAITRTSKKFSYHTIILFHVKDIDPIKCPTTGKFYLPKPEFYMLSGGMQSSYLSQQMIGVWRPITREEQYGIVNPDTGIPFELNEAHVTCMKVKPKQSGKLGGDTLFFDWEKQSYYEIEDGIRKYAGDAYNTRDINKQSAIRPNLKSWDLPQDSPF